MSASSSAEPLALAMPVENADAPRWSVATRVAFRFFFLFLLLLYLPFPLLFASGLWNNAWEVVVGVVGRALFGVTADATFNGSGDRLFHWIQLLLIIAASVAGTLLWSIIDRKAAGYPRLWRWFHVYIRFALAMSMIGYGSFKIIPSQFITPSLDRLLQPFGDASPMGLLWTFMGASAGYTIFTGAGELLGGLLLTNRRTTLLGALISAAVMTHVVALNFLYDVPVKIFSAQLLLTALVIAAPDAKRLLHFFLLDRPVESLFSRGWLRITARVAVVLFVGYLAGTSLSQSWQQRKRLLSARLTPSPISGIWNVDELTIDGIAHPPLTTDLTRWRRFVVAGKEWGTIQNMDDSRMRYGLELDETKPTLTMTKRTDRNAKTTLTYRKPDAKTLVLAGTFEGKKIEATLRKGDERTFLLTSRGFHWINDVPFNR